MKRLKRPDHRAPATDDVKIADFLIGENPQVVAYVISRLQSNRAAQVLGLMGRENRASALSRMMYVGELNSEMEAIVEGELISQFGRAKSADSAKGLATVAKILNELEREVTGEILGDLSKTIDSDRITTVRGMLFRFDDVVKMDAPARTRLFDAIPAETLTPALRGASPEVMEAVLSAISQRSRRMIENDLKSAAQARPADVATARKKIVDQVMRFSAEGQLDLPKPELPVA